MTIKNYVFYILLMSCLACNANNKASNLSNSTTSAKTDTIPSNKNIASDSEMELTPKDGEIREFGLLKEVEDSGYPIATLKIEFPERKFTEYFSLNLESVPGADINILRNSMGKYISFLYTSDLINALLDVRVKGKSILGNDKTTFSPEIKKISGILKGANEETPGDLPGTVSITGNDNISLNFDFFVTKEMVEVNGKKVVGFYEERSQNIMTAYKISDN